MKTSQARTNIEKTFFLNFLILFQGMSVLEKLFYFSAVINSLKSDNWCDLEYIFPKI